MKSKKMLLKNVKTRSDSFCILVFVLFLIYKLFIHYGGIDFFIVHTEIHFQSEQLVLPFLRMQAWLIYHSLIQPMHTSP